MKINKKTFIRWKIYLDRARMYIGYINFIMLITIFINSIKDNAYGRLLVDYSFVSIPLLTLIFIGLSLLLGFLDTRLGVRSEEARNLAEHNPVQMEILKDMKDIKACLENQKKSDMS